MSLKFSKGMPVVCHLLQHVSLIVFTDVPRDEEGNM